MLNRVLRVSRQAYRESTKLRFCSGSVGKICLRFNSGRMAARGRGLANLRASHLGKGRLMIMHWIGWWLKQKTLLTRSKQGGGNPISILYLLASRRFMVVTSVFAQYHTESPWLNARP